MLYKQCICASDIGHTLSRKFERLLESVKAVSVAAVVSAAVSNN